MGGKSGSSQSDEEYSSTAFFKKPLFVAAAVAGVVLIAIPITVAASGGDGGEQNAAASKSKSPQTQLPDRPHTPTHPSVLPSASTSRKPSSSPSPSASASAPKEKPEPTKTKGSDEKPGGGGTVGVPDGKVLIENRKTGMCVDLPGEGKGKPDGPVVQNTCQRSGTGNQQWTVDLSQKGAGLRGADLYLIRNVMDGLCLDLAGYEARPATSPVTEYHCDGTDNDNQLWWFDERSNGTYWIRNHKSSNLCLDVRSDRKPSAGAPLTIFPCNDADDHQWSMGSG
ncbi:RICIN domain-containing protein [Streptomyces sp. 8N616]|uniref:RICIN domain-containing protein n=1 Tax=Streptomyces sp. 8N616 TaxID=3457414 RepID=UPI003FD0225C